MIVSAAVKLYFDKDYSDSVVIPVHRHKDAGFILSALQVEPFDSYDGFLTDDDRFLDRTKAAIYAYECGQLVETAEEPRITLLMSEDLW